MHPAIRAVAFDIDGTLYPNARMYRASLPIVLSHLRLFRAFGAARQEIRARRPISDLKGETAELTARRLGTSVAQARARIDAVIYGQWELVLRRVPLYPGVISLLDSLRARGVPVAAMSDFPVTRKLEILGLEGCWNAAFSSEDIGYLKPNPEPFAALVERLNCPPESLLYVGNSYHYDVRGAHAQGFPTAHLARRAPAGSPAQLTFHRFEQLGSWIDDHLTS